MNDQAPGGPARLILQRARSYAQRVFPLSIATRLCLSFLAVAVLAVAANMIAWQSVLVIMHAPAPMILPIPGHRLPVAPTPMFRTQSRTALDRRHLDLLEAAIDLWERTTQERAMLGTAEGGDYVAAKNALRRAAIAYHGKALSADIDSYTERGQALIDSATQRRAARDEYSRLLQTLDRRVQGSLEGAWKIFGRVIARQSLVQLQAQLNAVRQRADGVLAGDPEAQAGASALAQSEQAFASMFNANEGRLSKSEGAGWVEQMHADFEALLATRKKLSGLNVSYADAARRFAQQHAALFAALHADADSRANESVPAAPTPAVSEPSSAPAQLPLPPPPPPHAQLPQQAQQAQAHARNLLALITALAVAFIALISSVTVRHVVTPVRRILQASRDLAAGKELVHVPRGGLRELDTLASAFNDMAAGLTLAQEASRSHQQSLEQKVLERTQKLQQLAEQDPLTSLPNRRHLSTLLHNALERAARAQRFVGIYFLDIDNFKNFNDSLGHVFGDRVLMSVANRLEEVADSCGFVARLGGDEFTIVFEDAESEEAIAKLGQDLVDAFQSLVSVDDRDLSISVSVGASIFPAHGRDAQALLRAADSALFLAKELGRSRLALFTPELTETAAKRFLIEQGLRRALECGEFELVYQPEIGLANFEVGLLEALLRWRQPDGRLARPGEFLAVAEQSGLIADISSWVLRTAVQAAAHWHHGGWPGARVAVNISSRQLLQPRFTEQLIALVGEHRLPPSAIELELTETVLQTGAATIAVLQALRGAGFGIALDDFGTGYSSLTSLEQLPLSRIKLDRSLIESIDSSARSAAIARAIIDLCAGLELDVTAEGIERPSQLAWLLGSPSMYLQGYFLSDAVSFDQVLPCREALLSKMQHLLLSMPMPSSIQMDQAIHAKASARVVRIR